MASAASSTPYVQASFDELGEPLREVTFVVVDLETTGAGPDTSAITEIGAVKVCGGEVLGEFSTLVDPGVGIPPYISVLTGITDAMLVGAPRIESVLPAFLEFARGAVLVAHNAPFDLGFLKAACTRMERPWPGFRSLDTVVLARRVLTRDEVPNCKLGTLAQYLGARTTPTHRALDDSRATVDVLHALIERLGPLGVHSFEELTTFTHMVSPAQRRKRYLAEPLPHAAGVYFFRDGRGETLYVGKSRDLRRRVRSYFSSSEMRSRMAEMVGLAEKVDHIVCAHDLEAEIRELRLIAEHKPRYNRRSRFPERAMWLKLTDEPFPRLSVVRSVRPDAGAYLGPFGSRRIADQAMTAVLDAVPLRQCAGRLPVHPSRSACALAEMGRCGAPCEGRESVTDYARHAAVFRAAVDGDVRPLVQPVLARIEALSEQRRYEDAAAVRDRLAALVRACSRLQRLSAVTRIPELVAARPDGDGGWELSVVQYGRLVAAGTAPRGVHPWPVIDALRATAETIIPGLPPLPAASAEETECILRWLERSGTRLVSVSEPWQSPAFGAGGLRPWLAQVESGRETASPFADRRGLHPVSRPARATA
ncbi:MAG TPA: DEDD exonuclease domain-containing protein [Mycobacteriales bacterium]|nr:DEDD exonuclease domain-containing protein [Mycobacteriales bacterium]